MAEHMKSPWKVVNHSWQETSVYANDGSRICLLDLEDWGVTEENQERLEKIQSEYARLIAAAPAMLHALKLLERYGLLDTLESNASGMGTRWDNTKRATDAARAALNEKGEGR